MPNLLAKAFLTGRSGTMGLLTFNIFRETFGSQADQILRAARQQDYQILLSLAAERFSESALEDQAEQIKEMIGRGVDGLLINTRGESTESERILGTVQDRVPVVTFPQPTSLDLWGVELDDTASFAEITTHLIRLGNERIGFIGAELAPESRRFSQGERVLPGDAGARPDPGTPAGNPSCGIGP